MLNWVELSFFPSIIPIKIAKTAHNVIPDVVNFISSNFEENLSGISR